MTERAEAVRRIGIRRDPADAPALRAALGDADPAARAMACRALGWQRDPRLAPDLIDALTDPEPDVRDHAVRALGVCLGGRSTPPAAAAALIDALADPDPIVRASAARTCGWLEVDGARPALRARLSDDDSGPVRAEAAHALGRLGDAQSTPALLAALGAPHAGLRHHAARALGLLDADALAHLKPCLADPDAEVRVAALRVVARLADDPGPIAAALRDPNPGVRATAAILAADSSIPDAALAEALAAEPHPEARHHLVRALIRRGERSGAPDPPDPRSPAMPDPADPAAFGPTGDPSHRRSAPAAERNRGPIADVLADRLPPGPVLEIAAGSGTHTAFFAHRFPDHVWLPTDLDPDALASIEGWRAAAAAEGRPLNNVRPAQRLDVCADVWPVESAGAVFCANMIHIAPWAATPGLMSGAARILTPGGRLFLYGPFRFDGRFTAPSNARFDGWLKAQDPRFGVRDLGEVSAVAAERGLARIEVIAMPANNHVIVFERR